MKQVYVVIPVSSSQDLEQKLQQKAVEGYRVKFPVQCKDSEIVIVMEREPRQGDEPSVYESRGMRNV